MRSSFLSFRHQYQERVAPCLICIPDGWPSASQNCWPGCLRQGRLTPLVGPEYEIWRLKNSGVQQERRARPWRAPGGGLDPSIKTPSPLTILADSIRVVARVNYLRESTGTLLVSGPKSELCIFLAPPWGF